MTVIPEEILAFAAAEFAAQVVQDYELSVNPAGDLVLYYHPEDSARVEVATAAGYHSYVPISELFLAMLHHSVSHDPHDSHPNH